MTIAFDTIVAAHALNEELPLSLLNLSSLELGVDDWGKGTFDFGEAHTPPSPLYGEEGMGRYCALDTAHTHLLKEHQRVKLRDRQEAAKLVKFLSLPGLEVFIQMEMNGIWVDLDRVRRRRQIMKRRLTKLEKELKEYLDEDFRETADYDSDVFLRKWIYGNRPDGLGLDPISWTDKGAAQVNEKTLFALHHPATDLLIRRNKTSKALNFFDQWESAVDAEHRLHPRFNLTGTVTGRRSCDKPNLQQTPRDKLLRTCLGAKPGWRFLEVDYSTLEVRIAAWFAQEDTMLKVFADGRDPYIHMASKGYEVPESKVTEEQRQAGKVSVLGFIYKLSARGFVNYARDVFHMTIDEEEAFKLRKVFFDTYPKFVTWHLNQIKTAERKQYVESPFGRRRNLMGTLSIDQATAAMAQRQAINSPVQGTGGDMNLASMISLFGVLDPQEIKLVGDIHDALLFEVREDCWEKWTYQVLKTMENPKALRPFNVTVPVRMKADAKIGRYWGSGAKVVLDDFVSPDTIGATWKGWGNFNDPEPPDSEDDEEEIEEFDL